ncbi:MAG TPA: hypothetical protein V6D47_13945 [Oscillatoriaceae cyanobacterium]
MAEKVRTSGTVLPGSISDFTGQHCEELAAQLEAIAETEEKLQTALLLIDMLAAGRSLEDIERSAEEARQGKVTSGEDFLAELDN